MKHIKMLDCVMCHNKTHPQNTIDIFNSERLGKVLIDLNDGVNPYLEYNGESLVVPQGRYYENQSTLYVICKTCISKLMDDGMVNGFYRDRDCELCGAKKRLFYVNGEDAEHRYRCHDCGRYIEVDRPYNLTRVHREILGDPTYYLSAYTYYGRLGVDHYY